MTTVFLILSGLIGFLEVRAFFVKYRLAKTMLQTVKDIDIERSLTKNEKNSLKEYITSAVSFRKQLILTGAFIHLFIRGRACIGMIINDDIHKLKKEFPKEMQKISDSRIWLTLNTSGILQTILIFATFIFLVYLLIRWGLTKNVLRKSNKILEQAKKEVMI